MNYNRVAKLQYSDVPDKSKTPEENLAYAVIMNAIVDLRKTSAIINKKNRKKTTNSDWRLKEAELNFAVAKNFLLGKYEISQFWFDIAKFRYLTLKDIKSILVTPLEMA